MQRAKINMFPKQDTDGKTYYMGTLKSPISINFTQGVAFLFYSEGESPELHFCPIDNPDVSDAFKYYTHKRESLTRTKNGNLPIELHIRWEKEPPDGQEPRKFYIGKIQFNGNIDCSNGVIFFAFIADEEEEQLQISVFDQNKTNKKREEGK